MGKTAVIIGGSNAGLMHGIMLKHHGYKVTILEKDTSPVRQGYDAGLKEGPDLFDFLQKHDRVKRAHTITCIPPTTTIDHDGKPQIQSGKVMTMTNWALLIGILRANFDEVTSNGVPHASVGEKGDGVSEFKSGSLVTNINDQGQKVDVQYEDVNLGISRSLLADIVIVADGSNSSIRGILEPDVRRHYAGYMCWRGIVREDMVDEKWNKLYSERATFHFLSRSYLILYTIPTEEGELQPGKRLHNWIWYNNLNDKTPEHDAIMTDINGKVHQGTVPRDLVQSRLWEKQKETAATRLPKGIAAIIQKTETPFVTKIYDVSCTKATFLGGKVFVVGDALTTLRPNAGMSTNQAAYHCKLLEQVVEGKMTPQRWDIAVMRHNKAQQKFAVVISSYGLGTKVEFLCNGLSWLFLLLCQWLGLN